MQHQNFYNMQIFAKMAVGGGVAVGVHGTGKAFGTMCEYIEGITSTRYLLID